MKMKIRVQATFDEGMRYGCEHHSHWQTKPCKECEYEDRMGNYNGHEDQLKIKMPPDWDKPKDDKLLTRQEAEEIVKKHFPNSFTSKHSIDFYVALGMLKLKEEKPKDWRDEPIVKKAEELVGDLIGSKKNPINNDNVIIKEAENSAIEYGYSAVSADNVVRLHKLIQSLLNIIKRQKLKEEKPIDKNFTDKVAFEFLDDDARTIKEAAGTIAAGNLVSVNFTKTQQLISLIQNLLNIIKRGKA